MNNSKSSFAIEVESQFAFLENEGFLCTVTSSRKVRYESNKVCIDIEHAERDGEVSIFFGRGGKDERFSFTLFLRFVNPYLEKNLGERLVDEPAQFRKCLTNLANALRQEGQSIIDGDDAIFERMKDVRWWDFQPEAIR